MRSPEGSEGRPPVRRGWTDVQVETTIAWILRLGLALSAALVLAGGALYLARHGAEPVAYGVFRGEPEANRRLESIVRLVGAFRGRGFIMAGLALLVATPVARVAFSVVAFARQRDGIYVAVTLFVLAVLAWTLFGSGLG